MDQLAQSDHDGGDDADVEIIDHPGHRAAGETEHDLANGLHGDGDGHGCQRADEDIGQEWAQVWCPFAHGPACRLHRAPPKGDEAGPVDPNSWPSDIARAPGGENGQHCAGGEGDARMAQDLLAHRGRHAGEERGHFTHRELQLLVIRAVIPGVHEPDIAGLLARVQSQLAMRDGVGPFCGEAERGLDHAHGI